MTNLEAMLVLNSAEGIGGRRYAALKAHFGGAKNIIDADASALSKVEGIGRKIASNIVGAARGFDLKKELGLMKKHGVTCLSSEDEAYPANLKNIYDPPPLLYVKGELHKEDAAAVAIVGARRASYYGLSTAERLAYELAAHGITIISGMARGIDTAAHKGALKARGRTIAVLGSGLANIYPEENERLADEIALQGAVLSEFPMEVEPYAHNFPRRNRIISGLSLGVVVVEAAPNSGALITADFALEQNREVFAVPGKVDSSTSRGTNALIKQGAKLVETAEDILEEVAALHSGAKDKQAERPKLNLTEEETLVYNSLSSEPMDIDSILQQTGIAIEKAYTVLTGLEIKRLIRRSPGEAFVKCAC